MNRRIMTIGAALVLAGAGTFALTSGAFAGSSTPAPAPSSVLTPAPGCTPPTTPTDGPVEVVCPDAQEPAPPTTVIDGQ
jgi:hypothetical protein